jgi:hypothetical protein
MKPDGKPVSSVIGEESSTMSLPSPGGFVFLNDQTVDLWIESLDSNSYGMIEGNRDVTLLLE